MGQTKSDVTVDIKEKIRQFIIDNFFFGSISESFADADSFLDNGIIDSTGILELIEFIEENFKITTENDELIPENLDSLNNVTHFVQKKMNN